MSEEATEPKRADEATGLRPPKIEPRKPRPQELDPVEVVPVYVWDIVVRLTHWLIVLSIVVLSVTGLYIGNPMISVPGEANDHFFMGTVRAVHFYAATVFALAFLSRLLWMFIGPYCARWHRFIPVQKQRRESMWGTFKFYLFAQRKPPAVVGHNPLAGLAYSAVFGLYFVITLTGLGIYSVSHPDSWLNFAWVVPYFGGLATARWIHHVVMWLLLGFAAHHVYSAFLVTVQERHATIESIVSGWKYLQPEDIEAAGVPLEKLVVLKKRHVEPDGSGDKAA